MMLARFVRDEDGYLKCQCGAWNCKGQPRNNCYACRKPLLATIDERRQALQREIEKFEAWAAEHDFCAAITEPADLTEFYYGHCLNQLTVKVNEVVTRRTLSS